MPGNIDDEEGLTFDISFALREVPIVRSQQERRASTWRELVASRVVAQLKRSNWIIRRGTPSRGTSATDQEMARQASRKDGG